MWHTFPTLPQCKNKTKFYRKRSHLNAIRKLKTCISNLYSDRLRKHLGTVRGGAKNMGWKIIIYKGTLFSRVGVLIGDFLTFETW